MSDYTESYYTKTGKKVKSIEIDRVDLTYNKVYDVFIDSDEYEFIIDDVGHKRYVFIHNKDSYELVDDVAEANNTTDDIHNTNETKLKFKDGDKVMVVNTDYISAYDAGVRVGDIGTVIESGVNKYHVKFEGTGYDCDWWFTDECIDLVRDDDNTIENENTPIKSDGTKSDYTNTGKKVMCINSNRRDLTYKKVYDVFTNQDSAEFIIDDVGDKRYESLEFPYWCEKSDSMVGKANETKPKFKVGDKVKVVNAKHISRWMDTVEVGHVGVIVNINDNPVDSYRVNFNETDEKDCWWFTDKCIELVEDSVNDVNTPNKKYNPLVVQQSGNHYKNGEIQPIEYSERNHLSTCQGNIVKYITRHKEKNGVDDLAKIVHYALLEALFVYGEDGATELRDKVDSLINIGNKE